MHRSLFYTLLLILTSINAFSQSGFNLGVGAGSTHYYGSLDEDNVSYNVGADVRYDFNRRYSASFSYHNTALQAYRFNSAGDPSCYFNTTSNDLELHFQLNIISFWETARDKKKLRLAIDMGPGLMFYESEGFYCPTDEMVPDIVHGSSTGVNQDNAFKIQFGGEIGYQLTSKIEAFASLRGHYIFSSGVDGYICYNMPGNHLVKNDFYYSTDIGLRLALYDKNGYSGRNSYQKRKSSYSNRKRFSGRQTAKQSLYFNKRNEPSRSGSRWQGRKSSW